MRSKFRPAGMRIGVRVGRYIFAHFIFTYKLRFVEWGRPMRKTNKLFIHLFIPQPQYDFFYLSCARPAII